MKKLLLALGILALICSPAMAGRNANGALVVHIDNTLLYTITGAYCDSAVPTTCDGLNTQGTDANADHPIFLLAAFPDGSSPAVTAINFGVQTNLPPNQGWFTHWAPCPVGTLELPDTGWPEGPAKGNAVAFATAQTAQMFKFYYIWCYGDTPYFVSTGPNPTTGMAQFADNSNPPVADICTQFGTVRWFTPGQNMCPVAQPTGACCFQDGTCQLVSGADCEALGGVYQGDLSVCDPNPCPQPAACCFLDGTCQMLLNQICIDHQGNPLPGAVCEPNNPCPQPNEACCFEDGHCEDILPADCTARAGHPQGPQTVCETTTCPQPPATGACCVGQVCTIHTQADCEAGGGMYMGDDVPCDPNPCPTATKPSTWGQIKANYR